MNYNHLRIESGHFDRFYLITETESFAEPNYKYNVQQYDAYYQTDVEKGCVAKHYAYCGIGRFCKTTEEAYDWIDKQEKARKDRIE